MITMTATGSTVLNDNPQKPDSILVDDFISQLVVEIAALQKLLAERDAEVAELKVALEEVSDHGVALERMGFIKAQGAEIAGQRELLRRAAEALGCHNLDHLQDELIAEVLAAAVGEKER